ncbi:XdhC family protein [Desulfosarcina sp.]|nr:XdhC family protein [Desulfosarcina sp.]
MKDILLRIEDVKKSGKEAALCIIISTEGSSPRKTGAKMIVYYDGSIEGTIGGGSLELKVMDDAIAAINRKQPIRVNYELEEDLSMNCGGKAEVYIEPILQDNQLIIFGAGHIGKALAKYAPDFGFNIVLIDHRNDILSDEEFKALSVINKDYIEAIDDIKINQHSYIIIVTPKHAFDEAILEKVAKFDCAYIGMIGSKTKVAKARKRILDESILTEEELNKVDMPIGIKFNAQTPEEIAISILAKLIDVKNSK